MTGRHRFRANWHDYNGGVYFVTVCCYKKRHYLGHIVGGEMRLSTIGKVLASWIDRLRVTDRVEILNSVIMPNHFHMMVCIRHQEKPISEMIGCLKPKMHDDESETVFHHNSLFAKFIGNLKGGVTRYAHQHGIEFKWQKLCHEHMPKDLKSFDNIMSYIDNNVATWSNDCHNDKPLCI